MRLFTARTKFSTILPSVGLFFLAIVLAYTNGIVRLDRLIYDILSPRLVRPPAENITIIAIDEESLAEFGQWPWPRRLHAELIDKLSIGGVRAIGFDVIFAEPDKKGGQEDILLSEAMERSGRVIMPVFAEWNPDRGHLEVREPIPAIANAAAGLGHVDFELDSDGIMRRTFLKGGLGAPSWNAFSVELFKIAEPEYLVTLTGRRNYTLETASPLNWVRDYEILVPFAGKPGHYQRISYSTFLAQDFDPSQLRDRVVFVGTTASGLSDALPTPVSGESVPMSGVEINANLFDALTNGLLIVPLSRTFRVLITAFLLVPPLLLFARFSHCSLHLLAPFYIVFVFLLTALLLVNLQLWYPPAAALLAVAINYPLWMGKQLSRAVKKLFKERAHADVALRSIGDGVITTDTSCRVKYMNPAAESLTGYTISEARGLPLFSILSSTDSEQAGDSSAFVQSSMANTEIVEMEDDAVFQNRYGKKHIARITAGPLKNENGSTEGAVFGIVDITEKKYALDKLAYHATHDFVTNLPNRSLLFDRLNHAITRAQRTKKSVAVLLLDLDNFKKVNDQLGHSGGDQLLRLVGHRLIEACRSEDTVARIGSDEFVILLESISYARIAAARATSLINLLSAPFNIDNHEIFITARIGISMYPKDGEDADILIKNADIALYEVKKSGRTKFLFFSKKMNDFIQGRLRLEAQLRAALNRSDLSLYYQPQVRLKDNKIIGVEALLRWKTEKRKYIPPSLFIPVAEESDLILLLSDWVLKTACEQARIWQDSMQNPLQMSINISPRQFREGNLTGQLSMIMNETGIEPTILNLEITESLIMQDISKSKEIMRDFKLLGGTVSIDDFGTGYSSLSYLKQFPLDKLKIDKSFIDDIDRDFKDEGLAKTIITMGHSLGLTVVAEGVETKSQLEKLKQLNCDVIQGFYYSKPLPPEEVTVLIKKSPYLEEPVNGFSR